MFMYVHLCMMNLHFLMQIERPLQRHGGRLGHDEKYCGSCFGAEEVNLFFDILKFDLVFL